jgi:hypothetical protein
MRPPEAPDLAAGAGRETLRGETPFATLLATEMAHCFSRRHAVALLGLGLMGVLLAFWMPTLPHGIYRFFARVMSIEGWPAIVVANDFTGLFFFVYWLGVFDVLTIHVVPLEERYLDILLSKPLTRRAYMAAKLLPILLVMIVIAAVTAAVHWLALPAAGLAYDPSAYAGAAAVIVGWAICLVALVNVLILRARDTFSALLTAFIPAIVSMFPGMIYMYRPDVFADAPALRDVVVFPMNLVWYPEVAIHWGPPLAALLLGLAVAFSAFACWLVERRDVR